MTDQRDLEKRLKKAGCEIDHKGRHCRVTHPQVDGFVIVPSTMGKGRAFKNTIALLRRRGLDV